MRRLTFGAYSCDGSFFSPSYDTCQDALNTNIDKSKTYSDGAEFSKGHCLVQYRTNGSGAHPLYGQVIFDVGNQILNECGNSFHGSFPTHNCDECHVTINYRG